MKITNNPVQLRSSLDSNELKEVYPFTLVENIKNMDGVDLVDLLGKGGGGGVGNMDEWYDKVIKDVTDQINAGMENSHVLVRENEILIMDTSDIATATQVWRWNKGGLGFSNNGYEGPFETAITASGQFVINEITCKTFTGGLIQANTIAADKLTVAAKETLRDGLVTESSFSAGIDGILSTVETEYSSKTETSTTIKNAINKYKTEVDVEFSEVKDAHSNLESDMQGAFRDGIISESEAISLNSKILQLEKEFGDMKKEFDSVYANESLNSTEEKVSLKQSFDSVSDSLLVLTQAIRNGIQDGLITDAEKLAISKATNDYSRTSGVFRESFILAVDKIGSIKSNIAETNSKEYTKTEVKQSSDTILQKVESVKNSLTTSIEDVNVEALKGIEYANAAKEAAESAQSSANSANNLLGDLSDDNKITPIEKQSTRLEVDKIYGEIDGIIAEANKFEVDCETLSSTYNRLEEYITPLLADLSTTSDVIGQEFRKIFSDYYTSRQTVLNEIASKSKEIADEAIKISSENTQEISKVVSSTNEKFAEVKVTTDRIANRVGATEEETTTIKQNVGKVQEDANKAIEDAKLAKEQADKGINDAKLASDKALEAEKTANVAGAHAINANDKLADISNDNKLTPIEKHQTKKEWDIIEGERNGIIEEASKFKVSVDQYRNNYDSIKLYLAPLLADIATTSDVVGTEFRANFTNYYIARQTILNAISSAAKALADTAKEQADKGINDAKLASDKASEAQDIANAANEQANANKTEIVKTNSAMASAIVEIGNITNKVESVESTVTTQTETINSHSQSINAVDGKIDAAKDAAISSAATDSKNKADAALDSAKDYTKTELTKVTNETNEKFAEMKITTDSIANRVSDTESTTVTIIENVSKVEGDVSDAIADAAQAQAQADKAVADAKTASDKAISAQTTADTAKTQADKGVADSLVANNKLADIASDSKLTASEKQQTKKEWDTIVAEKSGIVAEGAKFSVSTTDYVTKYNTLEAYITPLLASLTNTSDITGATFRTNFAEYYTSKQVLLNAISTKAKALADNAKAQADKGVADALAASNKANTAQAQADKAVADAKTASDKAIAAQNSANTAKTQADKGVADSLAANNKLADIASDSKLTASEKQQTKKEWDTIVAEKNGIVDEGAKFGVSITDYVAKYSALNTYITPLLASLTNTSDIAGATFRANFAQYYTARQVLLNGISTKAKVLADKGVADAKAASDKAIAAQNQANKGVSDAKLAKDAADAAKIIADKGVADAKAASDRANTAQTAANTANSNANTANNKLGEFSSDSKLTAMEKQQTKKEWDIITGERAGIVDEATKFSVSTTDYVAKFNALNTYITPLLDNLTITSDIVGTTFRANFANYYNARQLLLNAISTKAKALADSASGSANAAKELAQAMANGRLVRKDPAFKSGNEVIDMYNNSGGNHVVVTRIAKPSDCPTTSTHAMEIKSVGTTINPGWGGFVIRGLVARANAKFIIRFIAKIPSDRLLWLATNPLGNGSVDRLLTSNAGTGKYTEYIREIKCGSTGEFSGTGHFYLSGGATPSASTPLIWYIGLCEVYDVTDHDYTLQNTVTEVATVKSKTATLETNVNGIAGRVSSVETKTNTIDGKVTSHESRIASAEQKITSTAIINTVKGTIEQAKNDAIKSANSTTDGKLNNYTTNTKFTELKQSTDSFQFKISNSSGSNIIKNSDFMVAGNVVNEFGFEVFEVKHWRIHGKDTDSGMNKSDIRVINHKTSAWGYTSNTENTLQIKDFQSSGLVLDTAEMGTKTTIDTEANKKYTFTALMASHRVPKTMVCIKNTSDGAVINTTNLGTLPEGGRTAPGNWKAVTIVFTSKSEFTDIYIYMLGKTTRDPFLWIFRPMINKGEMALPYTTSYKEFNTGITSIDNEGIKVDMLDGGDSQGFTRINYEGVSTHDKDGNRKAWFGEGDSAYIQKLSTDEIINPHVIKWGQKRPREFYVATVSTGDGTGRDSNNKSNSINHVLNWIWNTYGCYSYGQDLVINIAAGSYTENMYISGWLGSGNIWLRFDQNATIYGSHRIEECTMSVTIDAKAELNSWTDNGATFVYRGSSATNDQVFWARQSAVIIRGCRAVKEGYNTEYNNWANYTNKFVCATEGARMYVYNCVMCGFYYGGAAHYGSTLSMHQNRGHCDTIIYVSAGSVGRLSGYVAVHRNRYSRLEASHIDESCGIAGMHNSNCHPKQENSSTPVPPPPPPPPSFIWVEKSVDIYSLSTTTEGSGNATSNRTGMWGQGNWGSYKAHRGYAGLGNVPSDWCRGGRNFTCWITLKRISSGGYAGEVPVPRIKKPDGSFWNSGVKFAHGQTKTIQLPSDISSAIANGSMKTLEMWAGKSANDYAFFDKTTIKIKCEKPT